MARASFSSKDAEKLDHWLQEARAWLVFINTRSRRKSDKQNAKDKEYVQRANNALGEVQWLLLLASREGAQG